MSNQAPAIPRRAVVLVVGKHLKEIADKRAEEAFKLRRAGATYPQICRKVGYRSVSSATRAVHRYLEQGNPDTGDARIVRELDLESINKILFDCNRIIQANMREAAPRIVTQDLVTGAPRGGSPRHAAAVNRAQDTMLRAIQLRLEIYGILKQRGDGDTKVLAVPMATVDLKDVLRYGEDNANSMAVPMLQEGSADETDTAAE